METLNSPVRIIPSLLISRKRLVKGEKFSNHKDVGKPNTTSIALSSQNADEILIYDLDSYLKKIFEPDFKTLNEIAKSIMTPLTFGGGIDSFEKAKKAFDNGADKIYLNSVLFKNTSLVEKIANTYGSQSLMLGINLVSDNKKLSILNEPKIDPFKWFETIQKLKIGEIKITYVDREGTKNGLNIETSKKLLKMSKRPLIFGGGIGSLEDVITALKNNIRSIALGTMINFLDYNIVKIKQYIHNNNFNVRLK